MKSKIMVILASMLIAATMLVTSFAVPIASASPVLANGSNESEPITAGRGNTTDLGGGSDFLVNFGSDASFGIVWGNQLYPQQHLLRFLYREEPGCCHQCRSSRTVSTVSQQPVKITRCTQ